jgi:hypothetical protein
MAGTTDTERVAWRLLLWVAAATTGIFLTVQAIGFLYYDRSEALLHLAFFALLAGSVTLAVFGIRRKRHLWTVLGITGMVLVEILTTRVIPIREHAPFEVYLKFLLYIGLLSLGAEIFRRWFHWPQK